MYDLFQLHLWKIKFAIAMPRQFHKDTLRKNFFLGVLKILEIYFYFTFKWQFALADINIGNLCKYINVYDL